MTTFESIDNHELEGEVYAIPTEIGGRKTPIHSGYRGQFFWHFNNDLGTDWIAETYFENDIIQLGETANCKIKLAGSILEIGKKNKMPSGRQFALREGSKIVAVGIITKSKYE
ncbi:hypothetical protein P4C99_21680 [Pontiellaceae bacterium B1224]|nr:hypothetical protein [Pontiellaceae bacterium B1224]